MPAKTIDKEAIAELKKVNWTGNIREFRNVMERLIILCPKTITAAEVKTYANPKG
jgi:DNA-binding NtrC family response regulator